MAPARLEAVDLYFTYGSISVVQKFSRSMEAGEVIALTGSSGRGKSTLLFLLSLMLKPQAGQILLDGDSVGDLSDYHRARIRAHSFGFVFQDAALDQTRTVIENVVETALYRGQSRADALEEAYVLLDKFGVLDRARHRPTQISGGQAQRISLCRALVGRPTVIFADEPTGNLDEQSSEIVFQALQEYAAAGSLVLIASHDSALVARCTDRIVL